MKKLSIILLVLTVTFLSSCKKDPIIPNEEELITTLVYTLTPTSGGAAVEFRFQDLDGDGGAAAILTEGVLQANTSYNAVIQVLNETVSPSDNITAEVLAEGEDHQFFFQMANSLMTVTYADTDASGNPIGIATTVNTLSAGTETLTITLKHEPTKPNNGTISDAGGESDIQVEFNVEIQ